jgi:hypothetical protein
MRTAASPILGRGVGVNSISFRPHFRGGSRPMRCVANIMAPVQKLSVEIPKNLDYNLAGERIAVRIALRALNLRMPAYFIPTIGPDENAARGCSSREEPGVETTFRPAPESLSVVPAW